MRKLAALARLLVAPVLLFVAVGFVWALLQLGLPDNLGRQTAIVPAGAAFTSGLVLFAVGARFLIVYVFGHELTHWLAAKVFRRRTEQFRVGKTGGSVAVERPNFLIVLAPYFVPIYTIIWIGIYGVCCFWYRYPAKPVVQVFYAGVGLTYAFHVALTVYSMTGRQPDLLYCGRLFSVAVILCCNAGLLFFTLILAGRQWSDGIDVLWNCLRTEYGWLVWLCGELQQLVSPSLA